MSGIALIAHRRGFAVTGSDLKESRYTDALVQAGISVYYGHDAAHVTDDIDAVIISSAVPDANPELVAAREKGIAVWPRARMLALLGQGLQTIAVAGTHGKTTSSSLLATSLDRLGDDPTFVIGGMVEGYGTNARAGAGEHYVVEADESDGSFTYLAPHVALITNVDEDHLDHYGSLANIQDAFRAFADAVPAEGAIVACIDSPHVAPALPEAIAGRTVITYGFSPEAQVRVEAEDASRFAVTFPEGDRVSLELRSNPGRHNMCNATGVLAVLGFLGFDHERSARAVSQFAGVRRRFDLVGQAHGITVVDDYGHHPTEIKATLAAATEQGYERVIVMFQPHRYTRTQALADLFSTAFADADALYVLDVYAAGETPIPGVNGKLVADKVASTEPDKPVSYIPHRSDAVDAVIDSLKPGDLVITMGAGDVTLIGPQLLEALEDREA